MLRLRSLSLLTLACMLGCGEKAPTPKGSAKAGAEPTTVTTTVKARTGD